MRLLSPIKVSDQLTLTEIRDGDAEIFVRHLNERDIYRMTLRIPFPYQLSDARQWIAFNQSLFQAGRIFNWAIREKNGGLIGGVGFTDEVVKGETHRAEIGYWLAKPYWGKGIMTEVVKRFCRFAFDEYGLVRLTACVFEFNPASARVAEKCGFAFEGRQRNYYKKDGKIFDGLIYANVKAEARNIP